MPSVQKTRAARRDLLDLWRYLDRQAGEDVATAHLLRIERVVDGLATFPLSARARPELGEGVRSRPVGSVVLYYRPLEDGIELLRVLDGRRDVGPDLME